MKIEPVTLTGGIVRLVPLSFEHLADLTAAGKEENIWAYMRYGIVDSPDKMRAMIEDLLGRQAQGTDLPFTVIHLASGKAIGMTRYLNIEISNRAVEIGGTWYTPDFQRTGVNTECKYLLLRHAIEDLGCIRVQFKTDLRNVRSQTAIERIGAVREGVLRNQVILPDGFIRSSVYYSILAEEWPQVKTHLETLLRH